MMLPISRLKGHQPVGMVTAPLWPSLSVSSDPAPHWLWLTGWSRGAYQATSHVVYYPPTVWIPEHTHLIQWERPAVELVPLIPPFYRSSPLPPSPPPPLLKLAEGWISPEALGVFQRRDKPLLLTNQTIRRPGGHASRNLLLLSSRTQLPGSVRRGDDTKRRETDSDSSSSPLHLLSVSPLQVPLFSAPPPTGRVFYEWAGPVFPTHFDKEAWPIVLPAHLYKVALLQPLLNLDRRLCPPIQCVLGPVSPQLSTDRWPVLPLQVIKEVHPSFFSSQFASRFTLLTKYRQQKRGMSGGRISYGGALLLRTERRREERKAQCFNVSLHGGEEEEEKEEGSEDKRKDKRPVASTPVPGSPWCVVWTGDDRVFFFNPTIHLSVWERPGELIDRDISRIIEDPPHKRKKTSAVQNSSSCPSSGLHSNEDDEDDEDKRNSKRNRVEEPMSLIPGREDFKLLPQELRIAHFRDMMLERGVSAFSSWEKELHKMVFDPRYLLLNSDQRKQVFDQFVKSRVKEEYKEKKNKLIQAREEFQHLLEEAKITNRSTFKEFCLRYRGDQRFRALKRKKEQEILFSHYITSLKKRDKENRVRLRKMR